VEETEDELRFVIEGDGFMRYQIRMMMACIIDIGKGKLRITDLKQILDSRDKQAYSGMAEACGLYLTEVEYARSPLTFTPTPFVADTPKGRMNPTFRKPLKPASPR
jgi:tRNA U38,U39,U40 pseudouridine synthase TruA